MLVATGGGAQGVERGFDRRRCLGCARVGRARDEGFAGEPDGGEIGLPTKEGGHGGNKVVLWAGLRGEGFSGGAHELDRRVSAEGLGGELEQAPVDLDGPGYPAALASWAKHNGCSAEFVDTQIDTEIIERRWDCPAGAETVFMIVVDGVSLPRLMLITFAPWSVA